MTQVCACDICDWCFALLIGPSLVKVTQVCACDICDWCFALLKVMKVIGPSL